VEAYAVAARLGDGQPTVQLYVEPEALQKRFMDVLDVLRRHEIGKVAFTDLVETE
jgi:hypothetical protein